MIGEEVSTTDGHLLALFIDRFLPPDRPAAEIIAAIHAQGGLTVAAHPFDRSVPSLGYSGLDRPGWEFDAIESFNAGVIWSQCSCNLAARQAARALGLPVTAGSDAHSLATVGQGYTLFPGRSAGDLYRAIKRHGVRWGGSYWSLQQYIDLGCQLVRQRGVLGSLGRAASGLGLIAR